MDLSYAWWMCLSSPQCHSIYMRCGAHPDQRISNLLLSCLYITPCNVSALWLFPFLMLGSSFGRYGIAQASVQALNDVYKQTRS